MVKKEAHLQAKKMFLNSQGKISNREIAKTLHVNPLTVGRWKKEDGWDGLLKGKEEAPTKEQKTALKEQKTPVVRKKDARDKAVDLYREAGGNITNKHLAEKVGVSPATISKWKESDGWITLIPLHAAVTAEAPPPVQDDLGFDVEEMTSPEQIIQMNKKIDSFLAREHLTASEIADLADAKSALLESVETYLAIISSLTDM